MRESVLAVCICALVTCDMLCSDAGPVEAPSAVHRLFSRDSLHPDPPVLGEVVVVTGRILHVVEAAFLDVETDRSLLLDSPLRRNRILIKMEGSNGVDVVRPPRGTDVLGPVQLLTNVASSAGVSVRATFVGRLERMVVGPGEAVVIHPLVIEVVSADRDRELHLEALRVLPPSPLGDCEILAMATIMRGGPEHGSFDEYMQRVSSVEDRVLRARCLAQVSFALLQGVTSQAEATIRELVTLCRDTRVPYCSLPMALFMASRVRLEGKPTEAAVRAESELLEMHPGSLYADLVRR